MSAPARPRVPRPRRPVGDRRWSVVYGIPTLPVDSDGRVIPGAAPVVGYIGQSVQTVKQREDQHRADQPFGDTICGGSWVIEEGLWTQAELDARERHYIRHGAVLVLGQPAQRPVYNYEHNLDNPQRIEVWRAREHRQVRQPGWQPSGGRVDVQRTAARVGAAAARLESRAVDLAAGLIRWRWTPARVGGLILAGCWLVVACVVGWQAASGPVATWVDGVAYGSGVATVTVGLALPGKRRRRRRR
ncbi:hypothetical protein ABZY58_11440 [Micromonospora tulbaghiae]|uniref:hypothetical protein n=1 Tax=Micromonospora tulbaghiae TaxID=479978 RepID=UPI0033AAAB70